MNWLNKWKIKINCSKSVNVTFTLHKEICPQIKLFAESIQQNGSDKYWRLHLDHRHTWRTHIEKKQIKQAEEK